MNNSELKIDLDIYRVFITRFDPSRVVIYHEICPPMMEQSLF